MIRALFTVEGFTFLRGTDFCEDFHMEHSFEEEFHTEMKSAILG